MRKRVVCATGFVENLVFIAISRGTPRDFYLRKWVSFWSEIICAKGLRKGVLRNRVDTENGVHHVTSDMISRDLHFESRDNMSCHVITTRGYIT